MFSIRRMQLVVCGVASLTALSLTGAGGAWAQVDQIPADAATVKLHPAERYTIHYKLEGDETGTSTEYWRDWGQRYVELRKTTVSLEGVKQEIDERVITDGAQVTSIDVPTGTATRRRNPMYGPLVEDMRNKNVEDLANLMMTAMGGKDTGKTANYAGESCAVWQVPAMGSTQCVTADGITLFVQTNGQGVNQTITATEVRRGDGGPDSAFAIGPEIAVQDMPDLNQFMSVPE